VGDVVTGALTSVVAALVAGWLARLRGVTIAGARTLAAASGRGRRGVDGKQAHTRPEGAHLGWMYSDFGAPGFDGGAGGGADGGGDGGGSY
jgi:hypothetical protein